MPLPSKQDFIDEGVRKVDEAIQADAYAGTPSYDLRNAARAILDHIATFGDRENEPAAPASEQEPAAPPAPVAEPPAPAAPPVEATAAAEAEPAAPDSGTDPAPEPGG